MLWTVLVPSCCAVMSRVGGRAEVEEGALLNKNRKTEQTPIVLLLILRLHQNTHHR